MVYFVMVYIAHVLGLFSISALASIIHCKNNILKFQSALAVAVVSGTFHNILHFYFKVI